MRLTRPRTFRNIKLLESERAKASFSLNMFLPASAQEAGFTFPTWEITGGMLNGCQRRNLQDSRSRKAKVEVLSLNSKIFGAV